MTMVFAVKVKGEKMNNGKNLILTTGDIFEVGEYIVYVNGDRYEIGKVKSLREDGAFVYYHEGDTAAKTPYDCMHKLINGYTIKKSTLGGTT